VSSTPARRLAGLDGVRGLAALFVVVNHVFLRAFPGYPGDRAPFWAAWFVYGRFAVVVFIVLSGFSLALSPARNGWRLDGVSRFAQRRARRILPAYWAALVFSLAVAWLVVPQAGGGVPDLKSVVVNGLLVQNLVPAPIPNRAFWSMALEAQLYVLFPLLVLMVRRRGAVLMVAAVTLVVTAVGIAGPHVSHVDFVVIESAPDLAALFAVGILGAGIVGASAARRSWPWAWLALAGAAPVLATIWWRGSGWTLDHLFWVDLMLGPAVACLLAALATGRPAPLLGLLDAGPVRRLGASSYSLYLTHAPIVMVVYAEVVAGRVSPGVPTFLATLALAVPLTIAFARVFASVFERPYSVAREPRREGVARQHHVADLADIGEPRAPAAGPGEDAVAHEPGRLRVADEHRRDDEVELVDEVVCKELRVHLAAALDHQPLHAARGEVRAELPHLDRVAAVDDRCDRSEAGTGVAHARARAVDDLLGVAGGEEVGPGVELGPASHRHLHRRRREPAGRPRVAAFLRAHEEPGVVHPHRCRADEDRVAGGANGIDPVEVGVVGEEQARCGVPDIAVDRDAAREQGVRTITHPGLHPAVGRS
jgi:peptidoglycan/LPS O-acetylase OafA/YrhL